MDALQRQQGLGMMLGGHGDLAMVMGPDEDMAEAITDVEITLCEECASRFYQISALVERVVEREEDE